MSLRAEPYDTGAVLPHERTHRGPIEGRLRLLRATRAQLEPIFLLYDGEPPLGRPPGDPLIDVGDTRLWRLDGDHGVQSFFAERQLLIADGHHRYETAVAFAEESGADRLLVVARLHVGPGPRDPADAPRLHGAQDIDPDGEPFASVEDALAALEREPPDRAAAVCVLAGNDPPRPRRPG